MIAVPMRNHRDTEFGLQTGFACSAVPHPCLTSFLNEAERETAKMANRKGVFIGAYVPNHLKESLRRRAAAEHRTLSQEITRILEEAVHGKGLPPGSVDRRTRESTPRRRATDPAPRRRNVDVSYTPSGKSSDDENA